MNGFGYYLSLMSKAYSSPAHIRSRLASLLTVINDIKPLERVRHFKSSRQIIRGQVSIATLLGDRMAASIITTSPASRLEAVLARACPMSTVLSEFDDFDSQYLQVLSTS